MDGSSSQRHCSRRSRAGGAKALAAAATAAAILALLAATTWLAACSGSAGAPGQPTAFDASPTADRLAPGFDPKTGEATEPARVTFAAVGDNLIHGAVYLAARTDDGGYDFAPMYEPCKPYIEQADVAYINQETICAGEEFGLQSYPMFNSPTQVLDGVAATGFDWISTSSNHSMDMGEQGVLRQLEHIRSLPLVATGTHESQAEADTPKLIERNGVTFGLASFTYGLNGMVEPDGKDWLVDDIEPNKIIADVTRLKEVSDVQIVTMHAGEEYHYEPSQQQLETAQLLADLGVDVVIGTHPHVVNPTRMLTGKDGNKTLVIYSLGNFLSAQDDPPRMLGEMARWTITYDKASNTTGITDVEIWPTVTHISTDYRTFRCYVLKDYTEEMAAAHALASSGLSREQLCTLASEVFGADFPIVM